MQKEFYGQQSRKQKTALEILQDPMFLCGSLDGRAVLGRMDPCVCMAESPGCPPKTVTLLTGYTPIQNQTVLKLE